MNTPYQIHTMSDKKLVEPIEPFPPEDWECCGSECGDACVWERYYQSMDRYRAAMTLYTEQKRIIDQAQNEQKQHGDSNESN